MFSASTSPTSNARVALVTGASRGIGRAIALALAADGAAVAVNYHKNETAAAQVVHDIAAKGGRAKAFQADVADLAATTDMIKQVKATFGGLDILVNNAGITRDNLLVLMKPEEWLEVITNNLSSLYNVTKLASKEMMRKNWGRIINISSVAADHGGRGQANYAAAKGGINGFTISLAGELGYKGITVNAIAPGVIITEMTERVRGLAGEEILKEITLKRFGQPEDISALAAFLASDKAGYITGQIIHVDGGFRL